MAPHQPYMYDEYGDSRFPTKEFDPKAATRASWTPQPKRPVQDGPLVSFNRHPDLHEVPTTRRQNYQPMSSATKSWIKVMRKVQLVLRVLELAGAVGLFVLMILLTNVEPLTQWAMRITPAVVAASCVYAIYHHSRRAGRRPPASSAAYQLFAAFLDIATLLLYAYGALTTSREGGSWETILANQDLLKFLIPAEYYGLIGAGGCHVATLIISLWLGLMFRRIANMPPDMNPLEDNLTSRVAKHKRNKSSVATTHTSMSESSIKRLSTPLEDRRRSGAPYEALVRPPSIPFMHTRSGSQDSFTSSKRDSRADLPSRQYGIEPSNSPRNSVGAGPESKRLSVPVRTSKRGSYAEVPLDDRSTSNSPRPSTIGSQPPQLPSLNNSQTRLPRFTEAWYASGSLISRTQQRQHAMDAAEREKGRSYEALTQRYDMQDSDSELENDMRPDAADVSDDDDEYGVDENGSSIHPNPLRSHPSLPTSTTVSPSVAGKSGVRPKTPFYPREPGVLTEVSLNSRNVSGSGDVADEKPAPAPPARRKSLFGRKRESSIQPEVYFMAKPYGDLRPATPPVMVGSERQVSSGNDYDLGVTGRNSIFGRRNVSGKIAEEGLAGTSRYGVTKS